MGFVDVVGTASAYVKNDFQLSDKVAGFLPSMIFLWFFVISIPTGILTGRIGRKNTVHAQSGHYRGGHVSAFGELQ